MNYVHTNRSNRILGITSLGPTSGPGGVMIEYAAADNGFILDSVDAPTVALELLKAAGQESVIVPKSAAEVVDLGNDNLRCGLTDVARSSSAGWARERAGELLAIANYREAKTAREAAEKAEAEAAEKKLQERRDALATKFLRMHTKYNDLGPAASLRPAIDYAIDLEDKLDGASRD